jgi:hypothetical protein
MQVSFIPQGLYHKTESWYPLIRDGTVIFIVTAVRTSDLIYHLSDNHTAAVVEMLKQMKVKVSSILRYPRISLQIRYTQQAYTRKYHS